MLRSFRPTTPMPAGVQNPAPLVDAIEESLRFNTSAQRFSPSAPSRASVELHGQ